MDAAISYLEPMAENAKYESYREALDMAIAALREQEERENPKLLTLDELRQMDGEPVWIERCGSDSPEDKEWALVFAAGGFCRTSVGDIAFFALYGIGWLAYRSKPKDDGKCHYEGECEYKAPLTNGDRFRAKSDEELAVYLAEATRSLPLDYKFYNPSIEECRICWLEWLQKPAEEDV